MLTIAVNLHRDVEAVRGRVLKACLDRAADSDVEREPHDGRACACGHLGGPVDGAVVDDHDREPGVRGTDFADDGRKRGLLVERGHDRDAAHGGIEAGLAHRDAPS